MQRKEANMDRGHSRARRALLGAVLLTLALFGCGAAPPSPPPPLPPARAQIPPDNPVASADPGQDSRPPDRDGDGIQDSLDACPDEPGKPDPDPRKNGCVVRIILSEKLI